MSNLYTKQTNGKRTFSGVVNPHNKENKLLILDIYEIDQSPKPKDLNKYLFKIMKEATNTENDIFKTL